MDKIVVMNVAQMDVGADSTNVYSRLLEQLTLLKMNKAPAKQWLGTIEALSQKGVKRSEMEASSTLDLLLSKGDEVMTKEDLLTQIARRLPRIKRVDLGSPKYTKYTNFQHLSRSYTERLYVLSSEAMIADDEINQLMYEIDDLGFDPAPLLADPKLVDRLQAKLDLLRKSRPALYDFVHHHYSGKIKDHGKNLMAHARFSLVGDTFFIEEIQSDWAQNGRSNNWGGNYPSAPFVTDTEQWAGLVVRDLLQSAARDPAIKRLSWIRSSMRNGFNGSEESQQDDLSTFYDKILRKLVEKAISKAGGKVTTSEMMTKNGPREVLGVELTDAVRDVLRRAQPMFSLDALHQKTHSEQPAEPDLMPGLLAQCKKMLGGAHTIRFVARLFDVAAGREVAGRHLGKLIEISRRAANPTRVARHEAWHFAFENLLFDREKSLVRDCFSAMNAYGMRERTIAAMRLAGMPIQAIEQCADYEECAAHAFSLWSEGLLPDSPLPLDTLWQRVVHAVLCTADWLNEKIYGYRIERIEDLFTALRDGELAARAELDACMQSVPDSPSPSA